MAEAQVSEERRPSGLRAFAKRAKRAIPFFGTPTSNKTEEPEEITLEKLSLDREEYIGKEVQIAGSSKCLKEVAADKLLAVQMGSKTEYYTGKKNQYFFYAKPDDPNSPSICLIGKDAELSEIFDDSIKFPKDDRQYKIIGKVEKRKAENGEFECVLNVSNIEPN